MKLLSLLLCGLAVFPAAAAELDAEYKQLAPVMEALEKGDASSLNALEPFLQQGNSVAYVLMGTLYEEGKVTPKDETKAVEYFQKSADKGNQMGQVYLADMLLKGTGIDQNVSKAKELYWQAANGENPQLKIDALKKLAQIQELELSFTINRLFYEAAMQGDSLAMVSLANQCYQDSDLPCSYVWYALAAQTKAFEQPEKQEKIQKLLDLIKGEMTLNQITEAEKKIKEMQAVISPAVSEPTQTVKETNKTAESASLTATAVPKETEPKQPTHKIPSSKPTPKELLIINPEVPEGTKACQGIDSVREGCYMDILNTTGKEQTAPFFYEKAAQKTGVDQSAIELHNVDYASSVIPPDHVARIHIPATKIPKMNEEDKSE